MEKRIIFSKNSINVANINKESMGLIIVYRGNKPIGYIYYGRDSWRFSTYIDVNEVSWASNTLEELCDVLQKQNDNELIFTFLEHEY